MEIALNVDLPLTVVDLPSPDGPRRPQRTESEATAERGETDYLPDSFASEAGILHSSCFTFSWRLINNRRSIEISPLELNAERLQGGGCQLKLDVPFPLLPNCITVSENGEHFIFDFITSTGHLYTVLVHQGTLRSNTSNVQPQTAITKPYSFDLVAPQLIKAVNYKLILVPLVDGSLIRLDRSGPLQTASVSTFVDPLTSKPKGSGFSRLFKGATDKVPGHPDLSLNAVVSVELIDKFFVTYSVNGSLRLWSLQENTCIQLINYTGEYKSLRLRPSCYLSVRGLQVVVAWPETLSHYELKPNNQLTRKNSESSKISIPENLRSWFVTRLNFIANDSILVTFKKNLSSQIMLFKNNFVSQVGGEDFSELLDLPDTNSLAKIKRRVAGSSAEVLRLVLKELKDSSKIDESLDGEENVIGNRSLIIQSLEDQVNDLASVRETTVETQWLRIDTMCRRLEALGGEILYLAPALSTEDGLFLWALRVSNTSLFCVKSLDEEDVMTQNEKILELAEPLLISIPEPVLVQVALSMLTSDLLQDRVESSCSILQKHLDYKKLNDIGRTSASLIPQALRLYLHKWAPQYTDVDGHNSEFISLSDLGKDAVTTLVYSYAVEQTKNFQIINCLAVIGMVEGWLNSDEVVELIPSVVSVLRRFMFISELGKSNLHLQENKVSFASFGVTLARDQIFKCNELLLLSAMVPPSVPTMNPDSLLSFEKASNLCTPNAELTLLQSFAALCSNEQSVGVSLAKKVSLSLPWPTDPQFGQAPTTQATWFYRLAKYSQAVNANASALIFAQYAESLSSPEDEVFSDLLDILFHLSLETGNISMAYTALTRRYVDLTDIADKSKNDVEIWLNKLVTAAARNSESVAKELIVSYPFIGFSQALQSVLVNASSFATIPTYKLRYAWHIEKEDYVGAAQVIYYQIRSDLTMDSAKQAELYTVCLNALSLSDSADRWLKFNGDVVNFNEIKHERKQLLDNLMTQI